jgi:hypothetical protein
MFNRKTLGAVLAVTISLFGTHHIRAVFIGGITGNYSPKMAGRIEWMIVHL